LVVASALSAVPTWLVEHGVLHALGRGPAGSLAAVVLATVVGAALFFALARRMRVSELRELWAMVPTRRRAVG
jgi:hypothetical protein